MTSRRDKIVRDGRWLRAAARCALAAGLALGVSLTGCEDKKPAPKVTEAPPPPPPPPPPAVSLDTLAQQLKVDPRVQIAPKVASTDEALARAALQVASAIAKGDANALKGLLTKRGQESLDYLSAGDAWKDATRGLEAVRIVALSPAPPAMIINPNAPAAPAGAAATRQLIDQALEGVTRGMKPEDAARERDLFERRIRAEAERTLARQQATGGDAAAAPEGGSPAPAGDKGGTSTLDALVLNLLQAEAGNQRANQVFNPGTAAVLLLAVQDERGAYLMGWQAVRDGETVKFDSAPASDRTARRASEFDDLGLKGFEIAPPPRFAAGPVPAADKAGEKAAAQPAAGSSGGSGG